MIHIVLVVMYLLLAISFIMQEKILGAISAFGIMTIGVYILINGIYYLNTLLIQAIGTISIGFGFYMLMQACFEIIKESEF